MGFAPVAQSVPACRQAGSSSIFQQMWYVYALKSLKDKNLYIGISQNPEKRLREHNLGMTKSTKLRRPFKIIFKEIAGTRIEARIKEKYYKSGIGREFLKNI